MASKNFCDICDQPALGTVADVEQSAYALNKAEGPSAERYQNHKMQVVVSWRIVNTYAPSVSSGHICANCLINLLNKHIEQIKKQTNKQ